MTTLSEIESAVDALIAHAWVDGSHDDFESATLKKARSHLLSLLAGVCADAERYRWLRDECTDDKNPQHTWIVEATPGEWDAAIDTARRNVSEVEK